MAVSYAEIDVSRFSSSRFLARCRCRIPFPKGDGESAESRRAISPPPAKSRGVVRGKDHEHRATDSSFRRRAATPTLVRETSQTGLVLGRLDRRDGNSRVE